MENHRGNLVTMNFIVLRHLHYSSIPFIVIVSSTTMVNNENLIVPLYLSIVPKDNHCLHNGIPCLGHLTIVLLFICIYLTRIPLFLGTNSVGINREQVSLFE